MGLGDYVLEVGETVEQNKVNVKFFAVLNDDNIVTDTYTVNNSDCLDGNGNHSEAIGAAYLRKTLGLNETVKILETWNYRQNRNVYGRTGATYDATKDIFIDPRPHSSYILDADNQWVPNKPKPDDGKSYWWNTTTEQWFEILPNVDYTLGEDGIVRDEDGNPIELD